MSPVEFKKWPCRMSLVFLPSLSCHLGPMSHVEFKNWPCRRVEFSGPDPLDYYTHRKERDS